ncbi:MAG: T9SS type A sorting domain-containing protein [Flavobacteriales bacterium]
MKMPLLLSATMATFAAAYGQFPYTATVLNEYYLPLDNPTSLGIEVGWDDPEVQIPLDFSIDLDGSSSAGILMLGGTGEMLMNTTENGLLNILWPISLDVMDIGAVEAEEFSSIQYQVTGDSPNRILKVEWDECGLYEEISGIGTTTARLSFQTWIYESGGIIEYRFGSNTIPSDSLELEFLTSGIILGFDYDSYSGTFYTATGDTDAPDWTLSDDFYQWYYSDANLSGVPVEGTVYRFGPAVNVTETETPAPTFFTYPNPTVGAAWIQNGTEAAEFRVFDATGRSIHTFFLGAGNQTPLPSEGWAAGTYTIRSLTPSGQASTVRLLVN